MSTRLKSGEKFPAFDLPRIGGGKVSLGNGGGWQLVVVYRGKHCPICKRYLAKFEEMKDEFAKVGTEIVAISADPEEKAAADVAEFKWSFPVGHSLSVERMRALGLYISNPRSPEETDRPFAEPGLFAVTPDGTMQLIDIANAPFLRPDPALVLRGITMARERNYPARGTAD